MANKKANGPNAPLIAMAALLLAAMFLTLGCTTQPNPINQTGNVTPMPPPPPPSPGSHNTSANGSNAGSPGDVPPPPPAG